MTTTGKLYPITCPCGATIHVGADAVEHVREMGRTIRDWETLSAGRVKYIAELEKENEELKAKLCDLEEVHSSAGFTIPLPADQMRLFDE